jgi:hypothetical protein
MIAKLVLLIGALLLAETDAGRWVLQECTEPAEHMCCTGHDAC